MLLIDIRYLQSFVTVVEVGSLAEAARRLELTPAAVAAHIHSLEDDLGSMRIKRSGRSVKPTAADVNILENSRSVLRLVRVLRAASSAGATMGELRLGVFASAMTSVLPPVLKRLLPCLLMPIAALVEQDLDVALIFGSSNSWIVFLSSTDPGKQKAPRGRFLSAAGLGGPAAVYFATTRTISRHLLE